MVIVLGYEEEQIHRAHGRPEPGMQGGFKYCWLVDLLQQDNGLCPQLPEPVQEIFRRRVIMISEVGFFIQKIGGAQFGSTADDIVQSCLP